MIVSLPAAAQTQQPIRVHCGGPTYTDSKGQVWQADFGFKGGNATSRSVNVAGTPDPLLDETSRVNNTSTASIVYTFPVANGTYHVNPHFAETSGHLEQVGARVFNVKIQGTTVFKNLDVYAAAGANLSFVEGADIPVTNGSVTIEFDNPVGYAKVDAIEILPLASSAPSLSLNFVIRTERRLPELLATRLPRRSSLLTEAFLCRTEKPPACCSPHRVRWESTRNFR
jgi:hypothetical protein